MKPCSFNPVFSFLTRVFVLAFIVRGLAGAEAPSQKPACPALTTTTNFHIVIPRAAFTREFLMSASIIPQASAATSTGLAGKVVRFELFQDGVDLYESTKGMVVTEDLPARRLLTTFPIVEQNAENVVIDFNRGMKRVFTEIWYGGGGGFDASARERTLEIPQSRVFASDVRGDQLVIRQSVQTRDRSSADANVERRYEVRYFFTAYTPRDERGREPTPAELRYARFFETAPQLETTTGRQSTRMARFDVSKPVVFHYSANTPTEYVAAVKEAILYWNRAFGKDLISCEPAPSDVTAPDSRYNLVQWVPWDNAGFAYADILIDPRSGESLHGQAYMTSVFALGGKARARAALRAMKDLSEKKGEKPVAGPPEFFGVDTGNACWIDPTEFAIQYSHGLEELLASDTLTDEAVLRASQDYVRQVVAHEVGHVLGLRHNFAGSLGATLNARELDDWFKDYLLAKDLDGYTNKISTTSMMEYSPFKAAVFAGWRMRTCPDALPYDRAAIQWGYFESKEPVEKKMLFGTDQNAGVYGDVLRFDYGDEPIVAAYREIESTLTTLPNSIIEQFIAAKAPRDPRDRIPLAQVNLNAQSVSASVASQCASILTWFSAKTRSLRVENQFDFIGPLNQEERYQAHWKSLTNQFERLGGVDRVLFSYLPADLKLELKDVGTNNLTIERISATNLQARLTRLLDSPVYTNFVGLDEKRTSFTAEEKSLIRQRSETFFAEFEKNILKDLCQRMENAPRDLGLEASGGVGDSDPVARLEQRIIDLAKNLLTAKDESKHIKGRIDKSLVEVVEFKYDHETRLAAAKTLNEKTGSFKGWSVDAKADLNKALKEDVDAALNVANFKEFKESMLSRSLREWYLRQQEILALLPAKPAGK